MITILLIITLLLALILFLWLYLFNIYEVKAIVSPEYLLVDDKSKIEIRVIPLNSFGRKAAFREVKAKFTIEEGEEIIENFILNSDSTKAFIESNGKLGSIVVLVEADYGLFPTRIEIPIVENKSDIDK